MKRRGPPQALLCSDLSVFAAVCMLFRYKGMIDCLASTVRNEGVLNLWSGFLPAWARVGPRVVVVFLVMEQLKKVFG